MALAWKFEFSFALYFHLFLYFILVYTLRILGYEPGYFIKLLISRISYLVQYVQVRPSALA